MNKNKNYRRTGLLVSFATFALLTGLITNNIQQIVESHKAQEEKDQIASRVEAAKLATIASTAPSPSPSEPPSMTTSPVTSYDSAPGAPAAPPTASPEPSSSPRPTPASDAPPSEAPTETPTPNSSPLPKWAAKWLKKDWIIAEFTSGFSDNVPPKEGEFRPPQEEKLSLTVDKVFYEKDASSGKGYHIECSCHEKDEKGMTGSGSCTIIVSDNKEITGSFLTNNLGTGSLVGDEDGENLNFRVTGLEKLYLGKLVIPGRIRDETTSK